MARLPNNTTGVPYNVTKDPQCRHSEKQGFVSYVITMTAHQATVTASCTNCASSGETLVRDLPTDLNVLIEDARNALMRVEAPPLTP